jgi:hypothetical protein
VSEEGGKQHVILQVGKNENSNFLTQKRTEYTLCLIISSHAVRSFSLLDTLTIDVAGLARRLKWVSSRNLLASITPQWVAIANTCYTSLEQSSVLLIVSKLLEIKKLSRHLEFD